MIHRGSAGETWPAPMIDLEALIDPDVLTAPKTLVGPDALTAPPMRRVDPHRGGRKTAASGDFHAKNRR